jgi:hypothetical protein
MKNNYDKIAQKVGIPSLAFLGSNSGSYIALPSSKDCTHNGLGLSIYTHATSPLRRYADLANQRFLKFLLFSDAEIPTMPNIDLLNERVRLIKKSERLLWLLKHVGNGITTVDGFVLSIDKKVKVYCPSLRRCFKGSLLEPLEPGDKVTCRIYCDSKVCNLESRYIVQIKK